MKSKVILTFAVGAFAMSACGGTAATNTVVNKTGNATNAVANTMNSNTNTMTANTNTDSAAGDVVKIDEAGIMMTVPKGFKFSKDGEDTVVKTEDEGVDIRFTVPKDGDYEKIVSDAVEEMDSYLDDVKVDGEAKETTVSGMKATELNGTAKDADGEEVLWNLTIIDAPKKPVLVNIYAEKASLEKNAAAVKSFLESVKKQ